MKTTAEVFEAVARREMTPEQGADLLIAQDRQRRREMWRIMPARPLLKLTLLHVLIWLGVFGAVGVLWAMAVLQDRWLALYFAGVIVFALVCVVLMKPLDSAKGSSPAPLPRDPVRLLAHLVEAGFGVGSQVSFIEHVKRSPHGGFGPGVCWAGSVVEVNAPSCRALVRRHDTDEQVWVPLLGLRQVLPRDVLDLPAVPHFVYSRTRRDSHALPQQASERGS